MLNELILVLFISIILLCLIALYRLNARIAKSIKNIAQFIKSRDNIEKIKKQINALLDEKKELEDEVKMGQIFYDNSKEAIAIMDKNGLILSINNAFSDITKYNKDDIEGKTLRILDSGSRPLHDYNEQFKIANEKGRYEGEVWNRRKTGEIYKEQITLTTISDETNETTNYIAIFRDTTKENELKSKLLLEAKTDFLTKLPNRSLFFDRLEQSVQRAERMKELGALIFIDLDHFKSINDTLGHHIGDLLLKEVSKRMEKTVRKSDTVSRLSGDEFTIILPQITNLTDAGLVAENIIEVLTQPYELDGNKINITCSSGITIFPNDSNDPETLLTFSDSAMYKAKEAGKNEFKFYSNDLNASAQQKRLYENKAKEAIENDDFYLKYLPIRQNNEIIEFEPLIVLDKTKYPELKDFDVFDLTEENSLIVSITEWTINRIAQKDLEVAKFNQLQIGISLSPIYFKQSNVVEKLTSRFSKEDAKYINIKISDSTIAKNITEANSKFNALHEYGFNIVIEDFGQGKNSVNDYSHILFDSISINNELCTNKELTLKIANSFTSSIYVNEEVCSGLNNYKITTNKKDALGRSAFFELLKKNA